jgi:hypothetical protein
LITWEPAAPCPGPSRFERCRFCIARIHRVAVGGRRQRSDEPGRAKTKMVIQCDMMRYNGNSLRKLVAMSPEWWLVRRIIDPSGNLPGLHLPGNLVCFLLYTLKLVTGTQAWQRQVQRHHFPSQYLQ